MITSSPGSTVAIIAAIIPSVEPQVTVISVSGSISRSRYHFVFRAIASRKSFAPHVIAYWLRSFSIALIAFCLISSGAAKSGKPCDKLTAPYFNASRVISRITDSVNKLALCETWRLFAGVTMKGFMLSQGYHCGKHVLRKGGSRFDSPILSLCSQCLRDGMVFGAFFHHGATKN